MSALATRKRRKVAFDPHNAQFDGESVGEDGQTRLGFICPSRRPNEDAHLLTTDEDGGRPACSCEGYGYHASCTHTIQAREIVRIAYVNHYSALPESDLLAIDRDLTRRFGKEPIVNSIRYDVLGEELVKRMRMRDPIALNARGRRAKMELFGDAS